MNPTEPGGVEPSDDAPADPGLRHGEVSPSAPGATDRDADGPSAADPGHAVAPVRRPTTSLAAFRDLDRRDHSTSVRRWTLAGSSSASLALKIGIGLVVATVIIGIVGSVGSVRASAHWLLITLLVIVIALAALAVAAGLHALISAHRTRSRGRDRAVIGMLAAVGSASLLAFVLLETRPAIRDGSNGPIVEAGELFVIELLVGDCIRDRVPALYDDPTESTIVVPCDEPHAGEVVAVLDLPPDERGWLELCRQLVGRRTGNSGNLATFAPNPEVHATYGVGQLLCLRV